MTLSLHRPFLAGQVAAVVHAAFGGLLQLPGPMGHEAAERQVANGATLQLPAAGQSWLMLSQAWPVLLQVPLTIAQSLTVLQVFSLILHLPTFRQSDCFMQLAPFKLHIPGWSVQSEACVQVLLVWMLHLLGSGVHIGGGQVVMGVQVTSGSGFVSQPAGL